MKHLAFLLVFLILILAAACRSASPTEVERGGAQGEVEYLLLNDGSVLNFPRQPAADGDQMESLLEGQLVLANGCLRAVTSGYEENGFLILWPSDAEVHTTDDGIIEVLNGNGQIAGRVDSSIRAGGGAMENETSMGLWESQIDGLPIVGCPGPYWVAGELYPLDEMVGSGSEQPLATPYAQEPAAGICGEIEGSLVSVSLRPDVPDPRCVRVKPDQHLRVKNEADQTLQVSIGRFQAELDPGEEVTFDTPFGDYLAPGVHKLISSAPPGGPEIWLAAGQSSSNTIPNRQPPFVIQEEPGSLYETVFSIPVGDSGIRYRGAGVSEMQVTGPIGLAVLPDGRFVIGDVTDNRLLWYDSTGSQLASLDLYSLDILNASDLVATDTELCLLEISFAVTPERYRIDCLSFDGELISGYDIPEGYHLEDGLYGLTVGGGGEILLEFYGETYRLYQIGDQSGVDPESIAGIPAFGRLYQVQFTSQLVEMPFITDGSRMFVSVMPLGGLLKILAVNPDGSFYALREGMVDDFPVIIGDQTIHYINAAGEQLGVARYPLSEWYSFVQRNLAVGQDGNVYGLITRPESIDILKLNFYLKAGPLTPDSVEPMIIIQPLTGAE